jgi:pimeloyl-ACP methyl ester carboxylesterase
MTRSTLTIQGIDVFIEGDGLETVLLIHGWPDTHRLWDRSVQALKQFFRCARFTLPGFDIEKPARATSLAEMTALIAEIVDILCPLRQVQLVLCSPPAPAARYGPFPQGTGSWRSSRTRSTSV